MGLSEISTSLITSREESVVQNYEEEKVSKSPYNPKNGAMNGDGIDFYQPGMVQSPPNSKIIFLKFRL